MSLNRIPFLEAWEHSRYPRGRPDGDLESDEGSDVYQDLPDSPLSSSFPSTYSRLNFNPYAGPGWTESVVDEDDHNERQSTFLGLSPTTTRESHVNIHVQGHVDPRRNYPVVPEYDYESAGQGEAQVGFKEPQWAVDETLGAFEVSPAKRIAQVCIAVIYCFLAAGIVFGFAALKPILIREKVYRNLCSRAELDEDVSVCNGQQIRLNLMFTIAAVVTNISALPVGTILDAYGPRVSGLIGSGCLAIGALLFAFAAKMPFDGYIPGYLFLSLGGPFIFISSFHLSNTFPKRSGLILSMLTGAFDASSAVFLILRLLNENTHVVSIRFFFLLYLAVPVFIAVAQILVMPATSYKTAGELVHEAEAHLVAEMHDRVDDRIENRSEGERQRNSRRVRRQSIVNHIQDLLDDGTVSLAETVGIDDSVFRGDLDNPQPQPVHSTNTNTQLQNKPAPHAPPNTTTSGVWGVLHNRAPLQQIFTPWFILIATFTVLMMLRINYFVATIRQQYTYMLSPTQAVTLNSVFDILLPVGGLFSVPFTGIFLDNFQTRTVLTLLAGLATLIGVLGCIRHSMAAAYANIVLFVLYRPFYYTSVSDYAAKVFGFRAFGKVYGLIICLAGMGNFAQAGLDALTLHTFGGDPVPVNVVLTLVVAAAGAALAGFVAWKTGAVPTAADQDQGQGGGVGGGDEEGVQSPGLRPARAGMADDGALSGVAARGWETEEQPLLQGQHQPSYGVV
ncbi:hypothetical protein N7510_010382 [Penicillium lagena]|uniref:uncharacterized protein n=1 Tax=Penicillium lagena TaxID=94218 RepID=UPI0025425320|nr:uncharacterized protein N7510_010382 [Penicillium lagena]KAJ5605228.1 hypothetical protein N7510_010382 [Penicillium lagena]